MAKVRITIHFTLQHCTVQTQLGNTPLLFVALQFVHGCLTEKVMPMCKVGHDITVFAGSQLCQFGSLHYRWFHWPRFQTFANLVALARRRPGLQGGDRKQINVNANDFGLEAGHLHSAFLNSYTNTFYSDLQSSSKDGSCMSPPGYLSDDGTAQYSPNVVSPSLYSQLPAVVGTSYQINLN